MNLRWFAYDHLPKHLQYISKKFHDIAIDVSAELKDSEERDVALRKLLEAKDAAVRAKLEDMD